jgi:radical SAM protein with 4Fe4S-binding SPASM domain
LIAVAKETGLNVTVFSNGTLLDSKHIESLMDARLDCLKVSLWGSTKNVYESNYPGTNPDYFDRIVDGLKHLASAKQKHGSLKPAVIVHHPINRNNYRTLDELVSLAHKTGCNGVSFSPLKTRRGGLLSASLHPDEEKEVLSSLSRLEAKVNALGLKRNIRDTLRRYEVGEAVWRMFPCYVGFLMTRVKVDGTIVPCNPCNLTMGNLNESSFQKIWNNNTYREFRQQTSTRQGLESMETDCDCGYCCYLNDNWRVHRVFKWIHPWRKS